MYENSGQGDFDVKISIASLFELGHYVTLADVDGDGDKDVLSSITSAGPTAINWHENLGDWSFSLQVISNGYSSMIDVADLDGDGNSDVITGPRWHKNRLTERRSEPLPGDVNRDGAVGFDDFLVVSVNFGKAADAIWEDGDFNDDSRVDFADFLLLSTHFGSKRPD